MTRRLDPADQRLIRLAFTATGRRLYEAIVPRARALERELTEALKPGERALLERVLAKLSARVAHDA